MEAISPAISATHAHETDSLWHALAAVLLLLLIARARWRAAVNLRQDP